MPQSQTQSVQPEEIYRKLEGGLGHELVDEDNVDGLIQMANQKGNSSIAEILREWRSNCGGPASATPEAKAAPSAKQ